MSVDIKGDSPYFSFSSIKGHLYMMNDFYDPLNGIYGLLFYVYTYIRDMHSY